MTHSKTLCAVLFSASLGCVWAGTAQADPSTFSTVPYNLVPGACSAPISIPVNNKPVLVMGTQFTAPEQGEGSVTLFRGNTNNILVWAGVDFHAGTEKNYNYTSNPPLHIMYLDFAGKVDVLTAPSSHIQICSAADNSLAHSVGYLTFVY